MCWDLCESFPRSTGDLKWGRQTFPLPRVRDRRSKDLIPRIVGLANPLGKLARPPLQMLPTYRRACRHSSAWTYLSSPHHQFFERFPTLTEQPTRQRIACQSKESRPSGTWLGTVKLGRSCRREFSPNRKLACWACESFCTQSRSHSTWQF